MVSLGQAQQAKAALRERLGRPSWLRGVGISLVDGDHCIQVNVAMDATHVCELLPKEVDGVKIQVKFVGDSVPL